MAKNVKAGGAYLEFSLNAAKIKSQLSEIGSEVKSAAMKVENTFKSASIRFNNSLAKKSISEIEVSVVKLRANLERKIAMNAPLGELEALKSSINLSENAIKTFKKEAEKPAKVDVADQASKWGMLAVGIQASVTAVTDFVTSMKQLIGESVTSAAQLEVLRSNFKGSEEDLELFRKATAGTVSDSNLIKLSNQSSALGLSLSQQAIFFSLAEDAADSFGGSVENGMEGVIRASEGSAKAISSLGIQKKALEARVNELAKAEGDAVQNLDADTQKRIRLQAIIELSGITLDKVKAKQKDENDLIEAMGVSVEEARIKLGKFILEGLTPLLKKFDESGKSIKGFIALVIGMGGTLIQTIPLIVQLYSANKMFAGVTAISAASNTANAASIAATGAAAAGATAPVAGFMATVKTGLASMAIYVLPLAALGAVILVFAENVKKIDTKKLEDAAKALSQLKVDEKTAKSLGFNGKVEASSSNIHNPKTTNDYRKDVAAMMMRPHKDGLSENQPSPIVSTGDNNATKFFEDFNNNKKLLVEVNKQLENRNLKDAERNILLEKQLQLQADIYKYEHPTDLTLNADAKKDGGALKYKDTNKILGTQKGDEEDNKPKMLDYKDATKDIEEANAANENFAQSLTGSFTQGIMAGENLGKVFENMISQLAGMVIQALAFKAIMSVLNVGTGGFLGSILGAHDGGSFVGTSSGVMKMARGGSFIVPAGFSNDSFPLMVESGERVTVTPANQVNNFNDKNIVAALQGMQGRIEALTVAAIKGRSQKVALYLDGKLLAEETTSRQNDFDQNNVKVAG